MKPAEHPTDSTETALVPQGLGWLDRDDYPFLSRYFQVPGGRLHYIDEGTSDHVLVMVHGNPTWSYSWRNLIKALSSEYRCIAVDHLGFGLSDKPVGWDYFPESHAENLQRLLDSLGIKSATVIVEDWGGPIGLSYAINHPDIVRSFVVMNTWMWPLNGDVYYEGFSRFMGSFLGRFLIRRYNFFARVVAKQAYGDKRKLTASIQKHYQSPLATPEDRMGSAVFPKRILKSGPWLKSLWERRERIASKPSLVLWGLKDIAFREKELNTWKEALHDAEVHAFEGVGHFVQEEAAEEILPKIRAFIARTLAADSD